MHEVREAAPVEQEPDHSDPRLSSRIALRPRLPGPEQEAWKKNRSWKTRAAVKDVIFNCRHPLRDGDRGERAAIGKGPASDHRQSRGKIEQSERAAAVEGISSDRRHPLRNHNRGERGAGFKGVTFNRRHPLRDRDPSERAAMGKDTLSDRRQSRGRLIEVSEWQVAKAPLRSSSIPRED